MEFRVPIHLFLFYTSILFFTLQSNSFYSEDFVLDML
jgi:hypothetical protein